MKVTIAIAQARGFPKEEGAACAPETLSLIDQAAERGARLVVLPQGYPGAYLPAGLAEECLEGASERARKHGMVIIYGSLRPAGGESYYIIASTIDSQGRVIAEYARSMPHESFFYHTFSATYAAGDRPPSVVEVDGLRIGIVQCGEIMVPEASRLLGIDGVDIIANPACLVPPVFETAWRTVAATRAIENLAYLASSQQMRREGGGIGIIAGPSGPIVVAQDGGLTCAEVDIDFVRELHYGLNVGDGIRRRDIFAGGLYYRRPELYGALAAS